MFSFIDSASEHAAALSHFHSYALFFLILVILFVVWLLKLVLNFVVLERDLKKRPSQILSTKLPQFSFYFHNLVNLSKFSAQLTQFLLDLYTSLLIMKNHKKAFNSYARQRTMYPYQGVKINAFPIYPQLSLQGNTTIRTFFPGYWVKLLKKRRKNEFYHAVLKAFRVSKHNIPFLFPYYEIDIEVDTHFDTVEDYLNINILVATQILVYKLFVGEVQLPLYSSYQESWAFAKFDLKNYLGYSKLSNRFAFKKYSNFVYSGSLLALFYGTDARSMFYLFFQHVRHRKILEWVWTCVPAFILLLLLYPSLILLYCYDRPYITKPYLTFKAIGHQWYWSYEYSDFVTSSRDEVREHIKFDSYMLHEDDLEFGSFRLLEVDRRIVLPIGICMRLVTTSSDVLHSWAVPALGVKIDAVPGRLNQFWIVADRPGTFYGQCSELCGVNHGFMPIAVESAPFLEFFKATAAAELAA